MVFNKRDVAEFYFGGVYYDFVVSVSVAVCIYVCVWVCACGGLY